MDTKILLGRGTLVWSKYEQVTDGTGVHFDRRRGSIFLAGLLPRDGMLGAVVAEVTATRKSHNLGDLLHKAWPSIPTVGQLT